MTKVCCSLEKCIYNKDGICMSTEIYLDYEHYCCGGCDIGWKFAEECAMTKNLTQLDKLEKYLKENGIKYERIDTRNTHQINVPNSRDKEWDAICHYGSFGYKEGLLEIYGSIVPENVGNTVEGYLTAEDVVNRIGEYERRKVEKAWKSLNSRFT